jgi:hypothetical protein
MESCKTCKFWVRQRQSDPDPEFAVGKCQRFPPHIVSVAETKLHSLLPRPIDVEWPLTSCNDWCGEWAHGQNPANVGMNESDYYVDIDEDDDHFVQDGDDEDGEISLVDDDDDV